MEWEMTGWAVGMAGGGLQSGDGQENLPRRHGDFYVPNPGSCLLGVHGVQGTGRLGPASAATFPLKPSLPTLPALRDLGQ